MEAGGEVTVNGNIELTQPLTVDKDVTLTGNGTLSLASDWSEAAAAPITVAQGATLTLDGVAIDGQNVELQYGADTGCAIEVQGALVLESGEICNFTNGANSTSSNVIYVNGGTFAMNGGSISGNSLDAGNYHGVVYLAGGASFTMNGGTLSGNFVADPQGASGVVNVSNKDGENTFVMEGGSISENLSTGVYVGSNSSNEDAGGKAVFTLNDGAISSNTYGDSYYAGGVYIVNGEVTMNGGSISDNEGYFYGGGVAVVANPGGSFTMNGGSISGNHAWYGGGIFVTGVQNTDWMADIQLNGGRIENNDASRQGGGIYVVRGQEVVLRNAAIYENEATIIGGGIWTCSTGEVHTYIKNGGAVFDNTANGDESGSAGDDLAFVQHDEEPEFQLSERMLGGGQASYYVDGGVYATNKEDDGLDGVGGTYYLGVSDGSARFDPQNPGEAVDVTSLNLGSQNYALKAVVSDNVKAAAKGRAALVITGNTANRGAGIGSNGSVVIGDAPYDPGTETPEEYSLQVTKVWDSEVPEELRQEVSVTLVSDGYELDSVVLNAENNWTASFTGLPEGNYTVKEATPEGMEATYSDVTLDGNVYQMAVTNALASTPVDPTDPPEDPDVPETGDHSSLILCAALMAAAGGTALLVVRRRKED